MESYRNLYQMIINQIEKRTGRGVAGQSSAHRYAVSGGALEGQHDIQDILNTLAEDLGEIIEARVISGLDISATTPSSSSVTITAGVGTASGKKYELSSAVTIEIPLDDSTYLYYVNLHGIALEVSRDLPSDRCPIGKIIVPKPGTTSRIVDDKTTDGYDAYIIPSKDVFFGDDKVFDDASKEMIKEALPEIAAEIIFGTLTASENLIITNNQGNMILDSSSMIFKNYGGEELAYYGADKARIGNIEVWPDKIKSKNFLAGSAGFVINDNGNVEFNDVVVRGTIYATSGEIGGWHIESNKLYSSGDKYISLDGPSGRIETSDFVSGSLGKGWRIDGDGSVEFQNALIRGVMSTVVFKENTISATGGLLVVSPTSSLDSDMTTSSITITVEDSTFENNEVIRLKDGTHDEWMLITDISNAPTYAVNRDISDNYEYANNPTWQKGTAVVSFAKSGSGFLYLDASSNYSPFIDVYERKSSNWSDYDLKTRVGMLDGIPGASGAGLYSENVYLSGHIDATAGTLQNLDITGRVLIEAPGQIITSETTPRLTINSTGIKLQSSATSYTYGSGVKYGTGKKYGAGILATIFDSIKQIPFYVVSEHTKADIHFYNRTSNPSDAVEIGDTIWKSSRMYGCITTQTTGSGAFVPVGSQPETLTDGDAKPNMFYYSSDRSKACYKDSGSVVRELY